MLIIDPRGGLGAFTERGSCFAPECCLPAG